jgi:hypothetical protein
VALSNWDTLAFSMGESPLVGSVTNHAGETVEIYKNWVNLNVANGPRTLVYSGSLHWGSWNLDIRRGPQEGVYVAAWSYRFVSDPNRSWKDCHTDQMYLVGCGVYGFDEDQWVGVKPSSVEFLRQMIDEGNDHLVGWSEDLFDIDWDQAMRINQGDRYLADQLDLPVPTSRPGKSEDPILIQALTEAEREFE